MLFQNRLSFPHKILRSPNFQSSSIILPALASLAEISVATKFSKSFSITHKIIQKQKPSSWKNEFKNRKLINIPLLQTQFRNFS